MGMTKADAARILDPETSREALLPYAYDGPRRLAVVEEACRMGAEALRKSTTYPQNEMLMEKELAEWNRKPAWIVPLGEQPWEAQWSIMRYGRFVVETNAGPTISICLSRQEYGKTWLAYRRPPEGESPHD